MNIIELKNVSHKYSTKKTSEYVLKEVNLELQEGKIYGIMGPSGSGKTTLLNIIGGLLKPTSGEVSVDGNIITNFKEKELGDFRVNKVGYIFQRFNLVSFLNVEENIYLPLRIAKKNVGEYQAQCEKLLKNLGIFEKRKDYIHELSGGQQQRVAIARCLLSNPKIILADEPTGSLDSKNTENFMNVLSKTAKQNNITVILVTHNNEITRYCDEVLRIRDGIIKN